MIDKIGESGIDFSEIRQENAQQLNLDRIMIEKTDAQELFATNLYRTAMLLEAIDKIRAYNRLYRMEQTDRKYLKMVEKVQDEQFVQIQQSCGEHAIISLATSFETYYANC